MRKKLLSFCLMVCMICTSLCWSPCQGYGKQEAASGNSPVLGQSNYHTVFTSQGLTTGYDSLEESPHVIGDTEVPRTYHLYLQEENFYLLNKSEAGIGRTGLLLLNGEVPASGSLLWNKYGTGLRTGEYLANTLGCRSEDLFLLEQAGYQPLEDTTAYYYLYLKEAGYAILIEITPQGKPSPWSTYAALRDQVTGDHARDWYQEEDRYNGIATSKEGFWAELQKVLTATDKEYNKDTGTDQAMTDATDRLQAACSNLISSKNMNTTCLYEAVKTSQYFSTREDYYSIDSWAPFARAYEEATFYLESLFQEDGCPTDFNVADKQEELNDLALDLTKAREGLETRADEFYKVQSDNAIAGIHLYAKLYDPAAMVESDYTADSWKAFSEARAAALSYLEEKGEEYPVGMSNLIRQKREQLFITFRDACLSLVETRDEVHVTVTFIQRGEVTTTKEMTLPTGTTVESVWKQVNPAFSRVGGEVRDIAFLNGIMLCNANICSGQYTNYPSTMKLTLRDGDDLVYVLTSVPLYTNISEIPEASEVYRVMDEIEYETITASKTRVKAGEAFTLKVSAHDALPLCYGDPEEVLAGVPISMGAFCQDKDEAGEALINTPTGYTTDENGEAQVILYQEGWVLLNAFDTSTNGVLCHGHGIYIYVEPADDIDSVKNNLARELQEVYELEPYVETYFHTADWAALGEAYISGQEALAQATTVPEARKVQYAALTTIQKLQAKAQKYNQENLRNCRSYLGQLPQDLTKLDDSMTRLVRNVVNEYKDMTQYQLDQLMPIEEERILAIQAVYESEAGLPPARSYQITVNLDLSEVPEEDQAGLHDMILWLQEHTPYEDTRGDLGGAKMGALFTPAVPKDYLTYGSTTFTSVSEAQFGQQLAICVSPIYAAYMHIRETGVLAPEGACWRIEDETTATPGEFFMKYDRRMAFVVNGHRYILSGFTWQGLKESDVKTRSYQFYDFSEYKGKNPSNDMFISVSKSFRSFHMPCNDVSFTFSWQTASGTLTQQKQAKDGAKALVEAAYKGYQQSDYSAKSWNRLTRLYEDALAALDAATDVNAIRDIRKTAIASMGTVLTLDGEAVYDSERGNIVGSVRLLMENQTYTEKQGCPDHLAGVLIDEWVPLYDTDTMMKVILHALEEHGYSWTGTGADDPYEISYLASIEKNDDKLGEFDGGSGSGWMGTLNDWYTNFGFNSFSVEAGDLGDHDLIHVVYTCELGKDVDSHSDILDTSLRDLQITGGRLSPDFSGDQLSYSLIIPEKTSLIQVTPTAVNKNYLVKTFLNGYNDKDCYYKLTEPIAVSDGDVLEIGCGEYEWPSMNNQFGNDEPYEGTVYTLKVFTLDAEGVNQRIQALPELADITLENYQDYAVIVQGIQTDYEQLASSAQVQVETLQKVQERLTLLDQIAAFKARLQALPVNTLGLEDQQTVQQLVEDYEAMPREQVKYITGSETRKLKECQAFLTRLADRKKAALYFEETSITKTIGGAAFTRKVVSEATGAISYRSSNPKVAKVSATTGKVTLLAPGTVTITASATETMEDLGGEASYTLVIQKKTLTGKKATLPKTSYVYTGKAIKPGVTVKGLKAGTDFKVTYSNCTKVGTATATVKGMGNYAGTLKVTWKILPKKAAISKLTAGKKQMKVKMTTKVSATGGTTYQIGYRLKTASKWKYTTTTAQSKTIKKLKKGKSYSFKVRAYKVVNKKKVYGQWSKVKNKKDL